MTRQTQFNKSTLFRAVRGLAESPRNQNERRCPVYNERHADFALRVQSREDSRIFEKPGVSEQFVFVLMLALHGGQVAKMIKRGLSIGVGLANEAAPKAISKNETISISPRRHEAALVKRCPMCAVREGR
jgi:hypothetical protein